MCGNVIIKVIDGNYDPSLVVNNWQDPHTGNTYDKVFAVSNFCALPENLTPGQEFSFYFEEGTALNTCVTCMALRAIPPKTNMIRVTASCGN
jgi:hypothetical protein